MICERCHANNPEGSRFCHACGAPLVAAAVSAQGTAAPAPVPSPVTPAPVTPAPAAAVLVPGQPPLRRHVSHMGKAAIVGFVLVGLLGVFIMGAAALSFMRPAVHPSGGGGMKPPVMQPNPAAPGAAPVSPITPVPAGPSTGPAITAPATPAPATSAPAAPAPAMPAPPEPTPAAPPAPGQPTPTTSAPAAPTTPSPTAAPAPAPSAPSTKPPATAPAKPVKPAVKPTAPPAAAPPVVRPPAPTAPAQPRTAAPVPNGPALALERYKAPSGLYAISYPQGWHVKEDQQQNSVVFYRDDPDEGASFAIAMQPLAATVSARAVLEGFLANFRRQYPDAEATILSNKQEGGADTLAADAAWTGAARQAMRGRIVVSTWTPPGSVRPWFVLMGGQAPAAAFQSMLATYQQMVNTLTF